MESFRWLFKNGLYKTDIDGVKTKKNIPYKDKSNFYQKFDVHYTVDSDNLKPIIVYFHGGGWTAYSKHIFTTLTRRLAKMGYVVFNCNYTLAPKHKMEEILQDCTFAIKKAMKIAKDFGGDSNKIILAGDSAGTHISSMIMARSIDGDRGCKNFKDKIKALILLYGVYDLETMLTSGFPNIKTYASAVINGDMKSSEDLRKYSPIHYNLADFPPCFFASGEIDKLHKSQSKVMYEAVKASGVKTEKVFFDKDEFKAIHAYMIIDGISTNVKTLDRIEHFLREVV